MSTYADVVAAFERGEVGKKHKLFCDHLAGSHAATWFAAYWLSTFWDMRVEVAPLKFAMSPAMADRFSDDGDLFVLKEDGRRLIVDVKGLKATFSGRHDWPFREVFVSSARSVHRLGERTEAYVSVSSDFAAVAIIKRETWPSWYTREVYNGVFKQAEQKYCCPLELVKFYPTKPQRGEADHG